MARRSSDLRLERCAVKNTVTSTDRGLARVAQRLAGNGARVKVGILADAPKDHPEGWAGGQGEPATLLEVAAFQEFGAPAANVPQRSFVRATVDARESEIQSAQARQIIAGKITAGTALERLGAKIQGMMQQRIAQGIEPENAPSTIERKGSSKPLVDTGQLRSAISYQVTK